MCTYVQCHRPDHCGRLVASQNLSIFLSFVWCQHRVADSGNSPSQQNLHFKGSENWEFPLSATGNHAHWAMYIISSLEWNFACDATAYLVKS